MLSNYLSRINYNGSIKELCSFITVNYSLGSLKSYKIIEKGYEDLNIIIYTTKNKYFCILFVTKLFPKEKSLKNCKRYVSII
jgi:hypothetical protein